MSRVVFADPVLLSAYVGWSAKEAVDDWVRGSKLVIRMFMLAGSVLLLVPSGSSLDFVSGGFRVPKWHCSSRF